MASYNQNAFDDELMHLRRKNASLEGDISDLRLESSQLKRSNTILQNRVKGLDKRVDRVKERVTKELGTLLQSDQPDSDDATASKRRRVDVPEAVPDMEQAQTSNVSADGNANCAKFSRSKDIRGMLEEFVRQLESQSKTATATPAATTSRTSSDNSSLSDMSPSSSKIFQLITSRQQALATPCINRHQNSSKLSRPEQSNSTIRLTRPVLQRRRSLHQEDEDEDEEDEEEEDEEMIYRQRQASADSNVTLDGDSNRISNSQPDNTNAEFGKMVVEEFLRQFRKQPKTATAASATPSTSNLSDNSTSSPRSSSVPNASDSDRMILEEFLRQFVRQSQESTATEGVTPARSSSNKAASSASKTPKPKTSHKKAPRTMNASRHQDSNSNTLSNQTPENTTEDLGRMVVEEFLRQFEGQSKAVARAASTTSSDTPMSSSAPETSQQQQAPGPSNVALKRDFKTLLKVQLDNASMGGTMYEQDEQYNEDVKNIDVEEFPDEINGLATMFPEYDLAYLNRVFKHEGSVEATIDKLL